MDGDLVGMGLIRGDARHRQPGVIGVETADVGDEAVEHESPSGLEVPCRIAEARHLSFLVQKREEGVERQIDQWELLFQIHFGHVAHHHVY
jgi:hypothetical protein